MNQWVPAAGKRAIRACVGAFAVLCLCTACSLPGSVLPVVKIGLVAPFEGPQRAMAYDALFATKLAIAEFNAQQRAAGGPLVELVALNDDGQVTGGLQVAREMAADPAIVGVVGPWSADSAAMAAGAYRDAGLAVVCPAPGAEDAATAARKGYRDAGLGAACTTLDSDSAISTTGPAFLCLSASDAEIGIAAAEYVAQRGDGPRVVVVRSGGIAGVAQADALESALDRLDVPVAGVLSIRPGSAALAAEVARLEPDVVFATGTADEVIAVLETLRAAGVEAECLTGPEMDRFDLVQIAGPVASGVSVVAVAPPWRELGEDNAFVQAFRGVAGKPPGSQAMLAYDATRVLLRGVAAAAGESAVSRANVSAQLLAPPEMSGLTGGLRFGAGGKRLDAPLWVRALED